MRRDASDVMAKARQSVGLTQHTIRRSWLGAPAFGLDYSFDRYPLLRGQLTGSRDGKPVAPLLGSITGYDGGTTDLHLGPMTFGLAYCDHVVLYRFTPRGHHLTDCEITWLVNEKRRRRQGLRPREPDLALGRHDDRGQGDHRAQPGGRRLALLRARAAVAVDGDFHAAFPALVRRRDADAARAANRTRIARIACAADCCVSVAG